MSTQLISAKLLISLGWRYSDGNTPAVVDQNTDAYTQKFTDGTGPVPDVNTAVGLAKKIWKKNYAVAFGTPVVVDLASLTDTYGNSFAFTKVKAILLAFPADFGGSAAPSVTIGPGGSNGFGGAGTPFGATSDKRRVLNGMADCIGGDGPQGGFAVNASTAHLLTITAETSGTANVRVRILGEV